MKNLSVKLMALLLAGIMMLSCLAACATGEEPADTKGDAGTQGEASSEGDAQDDAAIAQSMLDALDVDFGGEEFGILTDSIFESEIWGENKTVDNTGGEDQVINDAVYERQVLLEEKCKLTFTHISSTTVSQAVLNEASTATGDFYLINANARATSGYASAGQLYDYVDMGVDLDQTWWDVGTAGFAINGKVFFMNGAVNFYDDNMTYVMIFSKKLQGEYSNSVPDPYTTVLNWEWTLDYFNTLIQNCGVADDITGEGTYDENDRYAFITTWEYGNTFFMGSDLRYIINDKENDPYLFLADSSKMEKALKVLETSKSIYHDNHATYMSPPGFENLGLDAFKDNRGLFFGEIVLHLKELNRTMDTDFGVLPVPKYDKAQEYYRTWTHESTSTLSATSAIKDPDIIGEIITAYAILSYQIVKPAYYDIVLTSKTVRDPQSPVMLDLIFQNRVYDMAMYYAGQFGDYYSLFKTAVNNDDDSFSSSYKAVSRSFDRKLSSFLENLEK